MPIAAIRAAGLRSLQGRKELETLVKQVKQVSRRRGCLVEDSLPTLAA